MKQSPTYLGNMIFLEIASNCKSSFLATNYADFYDLVLKNLRELAKFAAKE